MYGNSRVPSYMNALAGPCDTQFSRWSLNTPNSSIVVGSTMRQPTASSSSTSSFCFTQSPQVKLRQGSQTLNQRPKSTILADSTMNDQQNTYINDLRQRYDSKTVVGIVKPMVHQRSYHLINHDSQKYKINQDAEMLLGTDYHQSTRSLRPPSSSSSSSPLLPPAPPSLPHSGSATVAYRSRRAPSQIHLNGQPPTVPRRNSSISSNRNPVSYRSSRTNSTCSSMAPINDSQIISCSTSDENNQTYQDRKTMVDVKRLELFYSSVGTLVRSSQSIACLFLTTARQLAGIEDWSYQQRGVPLWIYDTGANLKRARQVRLLLIQQDSCFTIWSTLVSNQAEVRLPKDYFITCWFPESSLLAVLQFEQAEACRLFYRNYFEILEYEHRANLTNTPTSLEVDTSQTNPMEFKSKSFISTKEIPRRYSKLRSFAQRQEKSQTEPSFELRRCRSLSKIRTVKKSSISGPINFEHVNHLSNGCHQDRIMSSTTTLRSLHASMSNLPSQGSLIDRPAYSNSRRTSVCFDSRTTAV